MVTSSLLCFLLLLQLLPLTVVAQQLLYNSCGGSNFTANSSYQSNLIDLLSTLVSDASNSSGFSKTTQGKIPDQVHGLVLCRGDINRTQCRSCLNIANRDVLELCPNNKAAEVWYDICFLRFSDEPLLPSSNSSNQPSLFLRNAMNVTDYFAANISITNGSSISSNLSTNASQFNLSSFDQRAGFFLKKTADSAVNSTRRFATGVMMPNFNSKLLPQFPGTMYGVIQCTPDLSPLQCRQCLEGMSNPLPSYLAGKVGGRVLGEWCSMRYEMFSFFEGAPLVRLPPEDNAGAKNRGLNMDADGGLSILVISLISGASSIAAVIAAFVLWRTVKKINTRKRKQKFYCKNMELLKEQQSCFSEVVLVERMKIYKLDELEKATNNFDKSRIVGGGGHGYVYKGILSDQRVVAIKKPKITDQSELAQFINEVFILSQTSHRNVVKFFGCCLETEVPLLVFEFISGGTLADHLLDGEEPLSFEDRLRIATEVAKALSYLHTEASVTIFHRDIKSSNILLDEKNTAKLADFGASRSLPLEQTSMTTVVQGTLGYLDPEYHQTGKLTDKSDVYSLGVILVQLLLGRTNIHTVREFLDMMRKNSISLIIDPLVLEGGRDAVILRIARLAERCLELSGRARPTMNEVEDELEALRSMNKNGYHRSSIADDNYTDGTRSSKQYNFEKGVDALKLFLIMTALAQMVQRNHINRYNTSPGEQNS